MLVALTLAAVSAAPPTTPVGIPLAEHCRERVLRYTQGAQPRWPRKLGELPPGVISHAVIKKVDGCPVTVLVRRGPDGRKLEVPSGPAGVVPAPRKRR